MKKSRNSWQFLNAVTGKGKVNIGILLVVHSLLGISSVFYALFLRDIINEAMAGDKQRFFAAVILFALLVCAQLGLRALVRHFEERSRSTLENRFKKRLFSTLMEKDYASVAAVHSGEWMNRLTNDTVVVANGLTEILPGLAGMAVKLVGAVSMIVVLEPKFMYLIVPGGVLLIVFSYGFRKVMKKLHKNVQEQDGKLRMYMQESLSGMLVVRSYGVESPVAESAGEKMKGHQNARMKRNYFSNICNIGFGLVMNGAYVLGAFFCGYGILKGTMSYGTFMAVIQLIGQIQAPFANISGFLPKFYSMMASCERLMEAEDYKDSGNGTGKSAAEVKEMYGQRMKALVLEEVSFSYRKSENDFDEKAVAKANENNPYKIDGKSGDDCTDKAGDSAGGTSLSELKVLSDVNITIHKGDCVAVMGTSGCGKSTLLKLLMGVYEPDCGSIQVEMLDGCQEPLGEWRRLFAYVPQGNCLMSGSIRDVVTFYRKEDESDISVEEALRLACADFVWELPEGPDTLLGEKGAGLSEGQMQRIAVARALYADAPILIFDEATSALDEHTEMRLLQQLKKLTDKTILIATHRKAALDMCNKKLVFEDGKICQLEM